MPKSERCKYSFNNNCFFPDQNGLPGIFRGQLVRLNNLTEKVPCPFGGEPGGVRCFTDGPLIEEIEKNNKLSTRIIKATKSFFRQR